MSCWIQVFSGVIYVYSMLNKNCTTQQTRLKQTSKSVLFSISHVLVSKDHPLNKDQMMLCTTRKRQEEETEICWFGCITAYILGLRVCVHMKLYHRGFGHSKSAPFISHACPTTQISMVTSVGHPMRGGGGAGGAGVRAADGEFWGHWLEWEWCNVSLCKIHTLGRLKSHFSHSHSLICCNLVRLSHPLVTL